MFKPQLGAAPAIAARVRRGATRMTDTWR